MQVRTGGAKVISVFYNGFGPDPALIIFFFVLVDDIALYIMVSFGFLSQPGDYRCLFDSVVHCKLADQLSLADLQSNACRGHQCTGTEEAATRIVTRRRRASVHRPTTDT